MSESKFASCMLHLSIIQGTSMYISGFVSHIHATTMKDNFDCVLSLNYVNDEYSMFVVICRCDDLNMAHGWPLICVILAPQGSTISFS